MWSVVCLTCLCHTELHAGSGLSSSLWVCCCFLVNEIRSGIGPGSGSWTGPRSALVLCVFALDSLLLLVTPWATGQGRGECLSVTCRYVLCSVFERRVLTWLPSDWRKLLLRSQPGSVSSSGVVFSRPAGDLRANSGFLWVLLPHAPHGCLSPTGEADIQWWPEGFRPLCTIRGVVQGPTQPSLPQMFPLGYPCLVAKRWAPVEGPQISPVVSRDPSELTACPKPAVISGTFVSLRPVPTPSPELLLEQRPTPPFLGPHPGLKVCLSPASIPSPFIQHPGWAWETQIW